MEKQERIYMVGQLANFTVESVRTAVQDWLVFVRLLTEPVSMRIGFDKTPFNLEKMTAAIQAIDANTDIWLIVEGVAGRFQMHIRQLTLFERNLYDKELFFGQQQVISDYCDQRMIAHGVYGYIRSYDEYLYNNVSELSQRTFETAAETDVLPKMRNDAGEIVVDCNQLAGYDAFYKGLLLTACWKMYVSSYYYQVIPKQVFEDVQQVQELRHLPNQVMCIELFQNPLNWDLEVNQHFQRLFRDQMGYDQLSWNNGIGILRQPLIEFAFGDQTIQTVQYQNCQLQPTVKKEATHFVTRSYDFVNQQYAEKRTKGRLNARAYFPWIDESRMNMMNYRVLNPKYSVDDGLSAYEFYIRDLLEIEVTDEHYQEYTSILRFYIPREFFDKIPLEQLKEQFKDTKISHVRKRRNQVRFDLKKGENHLRVIFFDYSHLEKIGDTVRVEPEV